MKAVLTLINGPLCGDTVKVFGMLFIWFLDYNLGNGAFTLFISSLSRSLNVNCGKFADIATSSNGYPV